jgi:hypothetical protein
VRGLAEVSAARALAAAEPDEIHRIALTGRIDAVAAFLGFASTRLDRFAVARRHATAALAAAERAVAWIDFHLALAYLLRGAS